MKKTVKYLKGIKVIPSKFVEIEEIQEGWFGVMYKAMNAKRQLALMFVWYSCRDIYQDVGKSRIMRNGMYFSHKPNDGERVILFLQKIEKTLKLQQPSKFRHTNLDNVTWIKLSPWWLEKKIRRSFLTLMLRIGMDYNPDLPVKQETITAVAARSERGKNTMPAIRRFLNGNTICPHENTRSFYQGWMEIFRYKSRYEVKKLLVNK